jgi:hypothetical protein
MPMEIRVAARLPMVLGEDRVGGRTLRLDVFGGLLVGLEQMRAAPVFGSPCRLRIRASEVDSKTEDPATGMHMRS